MKIVTIHYLQQYGSGEESFEFDNVLRVACDSRDIQKAIDSAKDICMNDSFTEDETGTEHTPTRFILLSAETLAETS